MTKLSKQKVLAVLLASVMTVSVAGMSTAYATDEVATEAVTEVNETAETSDIVDAETLSTDGTYLDGEINGENHDIKYYKIVLENDGKLDVKGLNKHPGVSLGFQLFNEDFSEEYYEISVRDSNSPKTGTGTYYLYSDIYYLRVKENNSFDYTTDNIDFSVSATFTPVQNDVLTPNLDHTTAMDISISSIDNKNVYHSLIVSGGLQTYNNYCVNWYKFTLEEDTNISIVTTPEKNDNFNGLCLRILNDELEMINNPNLIPDVVMLPSKKLEFSLNAGTYYIQYGGSGSFQQSYPCSYEFYFYETENGDPFIEPDPEPTPEPTVVPTEPDTLPTEPTTPNVTDPTSVTNPTPTSPTSKTTTTTTTTTGGSTGSSTNTGKVATGDTKSVIGLIAGLFASTGAIIALRRKRSAK